MTTRAPANLTHRSLQSLKPASVPYRVPDLRCPGLAVRVAPSGGLTWDLAFRIKGAAKVRRLSLGKFPDIKLEDARERAATLTRAARTGHDLIAEEAAERSAMDARLTVRRLLDEYLRRKVKGRLRTAYDIERRLLRGLEPLLDRPADQITRRDLRRILNDVSDTGLPQEADKRRQIINTMFRWAVTEDILGANPAAGIGRYGTTVFCDRVLSPSEIRDLWNWLETTNLAPGTADVLRLQLLLGARCGEVAGICAEEINPETWLWTLPAVRSKNKRPRATPLVGLARAIVSKKLEAVGRNHGPLFTTEAGNPLRSVNIGNRLIDRRDDIPVAKFTTHDLRRSVATGLAELGIALEVVAAVIGHETGSADTRTLVRHYVRTDLIERKRAVLEAWDASVRQLIGGNLEAMLFVCEKLRRVQPRRRRAWGRSYGSCPTQSTKE